MPLPPSFPRTRKHDRKIECCGFERQDGLWDIEGHLVDSKTYAHPRRDSFGERQPGEPLHDMWIRLTIDLDFMIHDVAAVIDAGPYADCGAVTPNLKALKGATIGPGWHRKLVELIGGIKGCRHLFELLGPIATTAFLTTGMAREQLRSGKPVTQKPHQLNACHIYRDDSPAVKRRWPHLYTGKEA